MLNKIIEMRCARLLTLGLFLSGFALFAAPKTAHAQSSTVEPIIVESQSEDGTVSRFLGLAAGPSSIIVISPYQGDTIDDADGLLTLKFDGGQLDDVELKEEFPSAIIQSGVRSSVVLLDLNLPDDSEPLEQAFQADENLDAQNIVTIDSFRLNGVDSTRRTTAQQMTASDDGTIFELTGMSESSVPLLFPYGGLVSDKCGSLTAIALPSDPEGRTTLFPINRLDGIFSGNSVASAFAVTETRCAQSTGSLKSIEIREAAIEESERVQAEQQEEIEEFRRQNDALQAIINSDARDDEIDDARVQLEVLAQKQADAVANSEALEESLKADRALLEEMRDSVLADEGRTEKAENRLQLWTYILYGLGALTIIIIGVVIWLALRSRRLRKNLAAVEDEKRDIEEAKAAAEASWHDCILENDQGLTTKLPGGKLVKSRGGVTIGRSREDADAVIDRDDVSRRHARFEVENDVVRLTDLGSTNKTRVNGGVLDQGVSRQIYEGDRIEFGVNAFTFKIVRR
ncbi:MAG: FHA domain-containing protein [Pseudomonadota bacterium]